jgi:hypothetical protein
LGCDTAIVEQPESVALIPQATASFTVKTAGTVTRLQWRKNEFPLNNDGRVSGADTATLTVMNVQTGDQGGYDCIVDGPCETFTSVTAGLTCRPIINEQPPAWAFLRSPLHLSVAVPSGAAYSYRWRQNGQNLFNFNGLFSGVTTRTLTILTVDPSLAGTYDCVLTDSCGTTVSSPTQIYCPSDFDRDGFITGLDFDLFVAAFEAGDATSDFDEDGFVTGVDFDAFVTAFEAGC